MKETLEARQYERESMQVMNGVHRYDEHRANTQLSDAKVGRDLADRTLLKMVDALQGMVEEVESGGAGRGHESVYAHYIPHFEPVPTAYITARVALNAAFRNDTLTKASLTLSNLMEDTVMFEELLAAEPNLANSMANKAKKWSIPSRRRNIMRKAAEVGGVTGLAWTPGDKIRLGTKLIEVFIASTGLCDVSTVRVGKNNTRKALVPTEAATEWLRNQDEKCALLEPRFTPMLVKPVRWQSPLKGGYLSAENRTKVISRMSDGLVDDMMSMDMTDVYDAINSVQETAWSINRPLYDVLKVAWKAGDMLGNLPDPDDELVVPRPYTYDEVPKLLSLEDMPDDVAAKIKEVAVVNARIHSSNVRLRSKRAHIASIMSMASGLKDEVEFYFPHNMDFRGRLYSIVPSLNPQGDDFGKSLIQLAEGKPLGVSGEYWLRVHVANLFGIDKCSFDERVEWTTNHLDEIWDSAHDPMDGQRFWCTADDPWCALAACMEMAGVAEADNPEEYVSHLPIAMDGSCSGIQHFSAMLRDKEGGAAVNLLKCDQPRDIYSDVRDKTIELLHEEGDPLGMIWADNLTRKIVKRPCMTFAYSVTSRGMRDQILDEMRKTDPDQMLPGHDNYSAAAYLAGHVETAINATVDRAGEAMRWLKDAVRPVLEAELPVTWIAPDGLPVSHRYVKTTGKRFNVWFQGVRTKVQLRVEGSKHDIRKQQAAIAPNYVHSMDACHLRMVVNRMVRGGITTNFAMIHDSFGCHACDIDELHFAIRDEFIKLYTVSQLDVFRDRMDSLVPTADIPPIPESGELNLEDIRDAEFFFS